MWPRWLVLFLALWITISSQPITNEDAGRATRQIDFIECCPCPGSERSDLSDLDTLPQATDVGAVSRGADVDDCPCRVRDADSDGTPSNLLPKVLRPLRPIMRPKDAIEETKPLLHPEVGLASSVLETLREATDEELQDAVARDAAKNAARVAEGFFGNDKPESEKKIITIIVTPKSVEEDVDSEASHPQGSTIDKFGQVRESMSPNLERGVHIRNNNDMYDGASNIKNKVIGLSRDLEQLKLRSSPSRLSKLFSKPKSSEQSSQKASFDGIRKASNLGDLRVPNFKFDPVEKFNEHVSERKHANSWKSSQINRGRPLNEVRESKNYLDNSLSPSNVQEQFTKIIKSEDTSTPKHGLRSFIPNNDLSLIKTPFNLKNLMKLKDVELIPPKTNRVKINIPPLHFNKNFKNGKLQSNVNDYDEEPNNMDDSKDNTFVNTKILDTLPNPSENVQNVIMDDKIETGLNGVSTVSNSGDSTLSQNGNNKQTRIISEVPVKETEIIDSVDHLHESTISEEDNSNIINDTIDSEGTSEHGNTINAGSNVNSNNNIFQTQVSEDANEFINAGNIETLDIDKDVSISASENIFQAQGPEETNEFIKNDNIENQDSDQDLIVESSNTISKIQKLEDKFEFTTAENFDDRDVDYDSNIDTSNNISNIQEIQNNNEFARAVNFENQNVDQDSSVDLNNSNVEVQGQLEDQNDFVVADDSENRALVLIDHDSLVNISDNISQMQEQTDETNEFARTKVLQDSSVEANNNNFVNYEQSEESNMKILDDKLANRNTDEESVAYTDSTTFKNQQQTVQDNMLVTVANSENRDNDDDSTNIDYSSNDYQEDDDSITSMPIAIEKGEDDMDTSAQLNISDLGNLSSSIVGKSNESGQEINSENECLQCNANIARDSNTESSNLNDAKDAENTFLLNSKELTDDNEMELSPSSLNMNILDSISNTVKNSEETTGDRISKLDNGNLNDNESNTCTSNAISKFNSGEKTKMAMSDMSTNDDAIAEASEPVINILPHTMSRSTKNNVLGPSLLHDIVVQPSNLFGGRDLFRSPIPDIGELLHINSPLPTLDDIRSRISSILHVNERDSDEDLSTEFDSANDYSNRNSVMATDSSTTNTKAILPPFKPFENINLDIFQINPLTQSAPLKSKIPNLNLNSYKANLAIPKSVELKPIKLQSSLGKDGGILGATLTFGPDKIGSAKSKQKLKSSSYHKEPLRNSLISMPPMDDFKAKTKANSQILRDSAKVLPEDTLRSVQSVNALSDNIRTHAENSIRNAQEMLASTQHHLATTANDLNVLSQPQDLIEMVSSARDDVNDKLQAIHSDLTDRLTSIQESIVDQSRLPSIHNPVVASMSRNANAKLQARPSTRHSEKVKPFSSMRVSQPTSSILRKINSDSHNKAKLSSPPPQVNFQPYKISKAASNLRPKSVEVPKLTTTSSKPPFSKHLQKDNDIKLKERKIFNNRNEPMKAPDTTAILRNTMKPFRNNKVTVSFTTTTRPSVLKARPFLPNSGTKPIENPFSLTRSDAKNWPVKLGDSKGFASELKPMRVPAPAHGRSTEMKPNSRDPVAFKSEASLLNHNPSDLTTSSFKIKQPTIAKGNPSTTENEQSLGSTSLVRQNPEEPDRNKPRAPLINHKPTLTTNSFNIKPPSTIEGVKSTNNDPVLRNAETRQNLETPVETKPKPPLTKQAPITSTSQLTAHTLKSKPPTLDEGSASATDSEQAARTSNAKDKVSWPKITDALFLEKVREALRARFTNLNSSPNSEDLRITAPSTSEDMVRSASDNEEIITLPEGEPLKENVSYRCKLVCVREPIE